jgi:hypothetical protein
MIKGDGQHLAEGIIFSQVSNRQFGFLYALFGGKVEDVHASEMKGTMADGSGCGSVNAHPGKESG